MVSPDTITTIAETYPWASWAVWDPAFPDEECREQSPETLVEFMLEHRDHLTTDVVLMGLNRADDLPAPFANFHAPTKRHYDYRLKEFIQDGQLSRLQGAYMTDLVDEVDPDSSEIQMTQRDATVFLEQLDCLGDDEFHVICFGEKPFQGLTNYFEVSGTRQPPEIKSVSVEVDGKRLHLYRVWFYGLYGVYQDKVEILEQQLRHLDDTID